MNSMLGIRAGRGSDPDFFLSALISETTTVVSVVFVQEDFEVQTRLGLKEQNY